MDQFWAGIAGWFARGLAAFDANGPFMVAQLLLLVVALPLWLRWIDTLRWMRVRRQLAREALALHGATTAAAAQVIRQLFAEGAPPLARLQRVRSAIEVQRGEADRFARTGAMLAGAMTPRLARLVAGSDAFAARGQALIAALVRLYLKEAQLRVGASVVHGDDHLGFAAGQVVAIGYRAELEALATAFAADAAADRARLKKALGRRRSGEMLEQAREEAEGLADAVRHFAARLQPMDPESTSYRNRPLGERSVRTLDGLIARFDRGGVLAGFRP